MSNSPLGLQTIEIQGSTFYVALDWEESKSKNSFGLSMDVKKIAKASERHFGCVHFNKGEDGSIVSQYTLNKEPMDTKGIIGAKFVAQSLSELNNSDGTFVFVKNIGDELSERFWICAVNQSGHIHGQDDQIIEGAHQLVTVLNELRVISNNITLSCFDSEGIVKNIANEWIGEEGFELTTITEMAFDAYIEAHTSFAKQIYKPSAIPVKRAAIISGILALTCLAGLGGGYVSQIDDSSFFSNGSLEKMIDSEQDKIATYLKSQKVSKSWNDKSFRKNVMDNFSDFYLSHNYTSQQIGQIFADIERNLPLYSVEWKITKIAFKDGEFFILYKRIEKSKGTFGLLDEYIASIDKQTPEFTITPHKLTNEGTVRVYKVDSTRYESMIGERSLLTREQSERKSLLNDINAESNSLKRLYGDAEGYKDEFDNLPFAERYVLQSGSTLVDDTEGVVSRINRSKKKLRTLRAKMDKLPPQKINEEWVNGNVLDFITMMHVDSLFSWTYPEADIGFPNKVDLKAGNKSASSKKKKKSSKSSKSKKVYDKAIESHLVQVKTTDTNDEEGSVSSYGVLDLQHLMLLVDKHYIQIELIEYLKDSEQWGVNLRFYTKTEEFNNTVVVE
tara:strand:- start:1166 stop:3016 length:1851 start_codon:yes stop_codon:yes gene_type:complete